LSYVWEQNGNPADRLLPSQIVISLLMLAKWTDHAGTSVMSVISAIVGWNNVFAYRQFLQRFKLAFSVVQYTALFLC
jgi:hypothetical protein